MDETPLFPLSTVLFPGSRLPLQIFEQRYLNLVKNCLKQDSEFVIVLISEGDEVGSTPKVYSVGTEAHIIDWDSLDNGLLGITIEGRQRVHISEARTRDDGLVVGKVEPLATEPVDEKTDISGFLELLRSLQQHPLIEQLGLEMDLEDKAQALWLLCGLLPIDNTQKQYLLELDDQNDLVRDLDRMLAQLDDIDQ